MVFIVLMTLLVIPRFIASMDLPASDDAFLKKNNIDLRSARGTRLRDIRDPLHKDPAIVAFLSTGRNGFELFHEKNGPLKNPSQAELQLLIPHLLQAGYNPSIVMNGQGFHVLHYAIINRYALAVEALLMRANINAQDNQGDTALHHAIRIGRPEIVQIILQREDVDLRLANLAQQTPMDLARNDHKIRPLLEEYSVNHPIPMVGLAAKPIGVDPTALDEQLALALAGGDSELIGDVGRPHSSPGDQLHNLAGKIISLGNRDNNGMEGNPQSDRWKAFGQRIKQALPNRTFLTFIGGLITLPVTLLIKRLLKSAPIEIPLFRKKRAVQVVK